eukprot:scaffold8595_cov134-Cylindrotheca_fusiformis.AAC.2
MALDLFGTYERDSRNTRMWRLRGNITAQASDITSRSVNHHHHHSSSHPMNRLQSDECQRTADEENLRQGPAKGIDMVKHDLIGFLSSHGWEEQVIT